MHKHLAFECRAALEVEEVVGQPLRIHGMALPYMVQAVDRREQFRAGSLTWKTVLLRSLHTQGISPPLAIHPGGVALDDRADGLHVRAELPDTTAARDAVALVKAGILTGLSVEFVPRTHVFDRSSGVTTHTGAELRGVALVEKSAYPTSVEARGLRLHLPAGMPAWLTRGDWI